MKSHKIGYIELKYNNKIKKQSVYMNDFTIYFKLSIEEKTKKESKKVKKESKKVKKQFNIYWSTEENGFPKDYIKMMKEQFFPKYYVRNENPIVAQGRIKKIKGKEELVLDKIMFPY